MTDLPLVGEDVTFEDAQALLAEAELGDGLPLVPPTARRLDVMLAGMSEPDRELGHLPPLFGALTPRAIAYNALIAGCRPQDVAVVEAAMLACLEPELNLLGLMTTTGSAAIATVVHGPIAEVLGLNGSINCLGPGNRANATIGRAVSLCLRNIGGAREGSGDMATCGQPGKYSFCFAEGSFDGGVAWPSLARRMGQPEGASSVTVLGVSGTAEVLPLRDGEGGDGGVDGIFDALGLIMGASAETTGANRQTAPPQQAFILPPELAQRLAGAGFTLDRIGQAIVEAAAKGGRALVSAAGDIHPIVAGGAGVKIAYLPPWGGGTRMVSKDLS